MMAAFCDDIDFDNYDKLMLKLYDLIKSRDEQKIKAELPHFAIRTNENS